LSIIWNRRFSNREKKLYTFVLVKSSELSNLRLYLRCGHRRLWLMAIASTMLCDVTVLYSGCHHHMWHTLTYHTPLGYLQCVSMLSAILLLPSADGGGKIAE